MPSSQHVDHFSDSLNPPIDEKRPDQTVGATGTESLIGQRYCNQESQIAIGID
jgi:hypothetical protein